MRGAIARVAKTSTALLIFVACCVAVIPFWPSFPSADLDSAYKFALNRAVAQHEVFGRDIIFTFGPYASAFTNSYDPATDAMAMVATSIIAAALAAGLIVLTSGAWRGVALLLAIVLPWPINRDPMFFLLPMLFLAVAAKSRTLGREAAPAALLLAFAMALTVLVKGTFGATGVIGLTGGCMILVLRRRLVLAAAVAIIVPAVICAAWVLAQQPLDGSPRFFSGEAEVTSGYTDAMSLPGSAWVLAAMLTGTAILLLSHMRAFLRAGWPGAILGAGSAAILFLTFKAGFVRQDGHVAISAISLALIASALAFVNRGVVPTLGLVVALACAFVIDDGVEWTGPRAALDRVVARYTDAMHGVRDRLQGGAALQAANASAMAALRAKYPLPALSGTTDIYSVGQSMLLASGIAWSPRPVLQSYSAYTPALEEADARHLEGDGAPDNILVRVDPIDGRFPSLEDGPSWLPLLARYSVASMLGEMALLRKRTPDDTTQVSLLRQSDGPTRHSFDAPVPIQHGDFPLWAWIDVEPTIWGHIASVLFKSPPLTLNVGLSNGATASYRFIPGMAKAGFMLAPLIADSAHLFASEIPGYRAPADSIPLSINISGNAVFWRNTYLFKTASMTVPVQTAAYKVFAAPVVGAPAEDGNAACWLDSINGNIANHAKLFRAHGPTELVGWAYGSGNQAVIPDAISVTLLAPDGTISAFPTTLLSRLDVAAYFHQPQLSDIGFRALSDLRNFHGLYRLGVQIKSDGHRWACSLGDIDIADKS